MRKILVSILALVMSLSLVNTAGAETEVADQGCMTGYATLQQLVGADYRQTFTPSVDRLTAIELELAGDGVGDVSINLYKDGAFVVSSETVPETNGTVRFDFSGTFNLMVGQEYSIKPKPMAGNTSLFWYGSNSCGYPGVATLSYGAKVVELSYDFMFQTHGYNSSTPGGEEEAGAPPAGGGEEGGSTPPASQVENEDLGAFGGSANLNIATTPQEETSSEISAPSNLSVSSWNESATLSWEASSTEDIDGYKIFRSTKEDEDFEVVAMVVKDSLNFTDEVVYEGVEYYYFVRAYKGESESASTETVAVTIVKDRVFSLSSGFPIIDIFKGFPLYLQIILIIGLELILGLLGYLIYRVVKSRKETHLKPVK